MATLSSELNTILHNVYPDKSINIPTQSSEVHTFVSGLVKRLYPVYAAYEEMFSAAHKAAGRSAWKDEKVVRLAGLWMRTAYGISTLEILDKLNEFNFPVSSDDSYQRMREYRCEEQLKKSKECIMVYEKVRKGFCWQQGCLKEPEEGISEEFYKEFYQGRFSHLRDLFNDYVRIVRLAQQKIGLYSDFRIAADHENTPFAYYREQPLDPSSAYPIFYREYKRTPRLEIMPPEPKESLETRQKVYDSKSMAAKYQEIVTLLHKEGIWSNPDFIQKFDELFSYTYTVAMQSLEKAVAESSEESLVTTLTDRYSNTAQELFSFLKIYHFARGDAKFFEVKERSPTLISFDDQHAHLFYQSGAEQFKWRTLFNYCCDLVAYHVSLNRMDDYEMNLHRWASRDEEGKPFNLFPGITPFADWDVKDKEEVLSEKSSTSTEGFASKTDVESSNKKVEMLSVSFLQLTDAPKAFKKTSRLIEKPQEPKESVSSKEFFSKISNPIQHYAWAYSKVNQILECNSKPWQDSAVISIYNDLICIAFTSGIKNLEKLVANTTEENRALELTKTEFAKDFFELLYLYHRARGFIEIRKDEDIFTEEDVTPFYQAGTKQNGWRMLFNYYCDLVTYHVAFNCEDEQEMNFYAWIQKDEEGKPFKLFPADLLV